MDIVHQSRAHEILENIYHKGQDRIWDGREVLNDLLAKHGGIATLDSNVSNSLRRVLSMIMKGEKAAWNISLQLAEEIDDVEAKMAATSQAHDESRHFYVIRDYIKHMGEVSRDLPPTVFRALSMVERANTLGKKLLGMQLMVEPIALTIFQELRRLNIDPVLSDLLPFFERDEARHVALGVQYLPQVIRKMNPVQITSLIAWQFRLFMLELSAMRELKKDLEILGLNPKKIFSLAESKQLDALDKFTIEMGVTPKIWIPLKKTIQIGKELVF